MSNETKWTQGPWRYQKHNRPISGTAYHEIFTDTESCFDDLIARADSQDNANLIAAAPELYDELLDRYTQTKCGCAHSACRRCEDDRNTERVLAKARGE